MNEFRQRVIGDSIMIFFSALLAGNSFAHGWWFLTVLGVIVTLIWSDNLRLSFQIDALEGSCTE